MGSGLGSGFGSGSGLAMAGLNTTSEDRRQNEMSELFDSSPWGSRPIPDARPLLKAMAAPAIGARAFEPPPALPIGMFPSTLESSRVPPASR